MYVGYLKWLMFVLSEFKWGLHANSWMSLIGGPANAVACALHFLPLKEPQTEPLLGERIVFWPLFSAPPSSLLVSRKMWISSSINLLLRDAVIGGSFRNACSVVFFWNCGAFEIKKNPWNKTEHQQTKHFPDTEEKLLSVLTEKQKLIEI